MIRISQWRENHCKTNTSIRRKSRTGRILKLLDNLQKLICRTVITSVTIPKCYKDVYVNSFFPHTAQLWNSLPVECFPLTYDQNGFKCRNNRHLMVDSFWTGFLYALIFLCLLFLVTPYLVVTVELCMEWIPVKKNISRWIGQENLIDVRWNRIKSHA